MTDGLWIAGGPREPAGADAGTLTLVNPTTEEPIGEVVDAGPVDVDAAVAAAGDALADPAWRDLTPADRAGLLRGLADALERRAGELAPLISTENGMPIKMVRWGNVGGAAFSYRYFADLAQRRASEELRTSRSGPPTRTLVRRGPVGVAGIIAPWNGPQILVAWKLGPALAAGCTAVVKPAPATSLDTLVLAQAAAEAGFPPGVVNVVSGGAETGTALVEHPDVAKVAFTGSTAAGRDIAARCGAQLKRVTLELGGKSAAILLDDADLDAFSRSVTRVCAPNSGQVCYSCTRVIAPRGRYAEALEAVVAGMRSARLGDPLSEQTNFGPLVSARQRERVESYIAAGLDEGAELVLGGGRPAGIERGYFVEPTVFAGVDSAMRIAQEEIFGPVLVVIAHGGDDDAVAIANDSSYGLGGAVFSADPERALGVARRVQTGTIGLGGYDPTLDAPFGGVKNSGLGRELGPEGLEEYTEYQSIYNAPESLSA